MPNDDAGGGRRGLRAAPSPSLFAAVRAAYGFSAADDAADLGGSSCLNLLVRGDGGRWVIRVYRPHVTEGRLAAIQAARRALAAEGVPCAEARPARDGRPWVTWGGRLVEVEPYIDHDAQMDGWERVEAGLPVLGRLHEILGAAEIGTEGRHPLFANHVEARDTVERTLRGTRRIRAWGPTAAERRVAEQAEELASLAAAAERGLADRLPRQLVHGDFWDNNVGFRHGRVVLVTDFDFMGERPRVEDLALTLFCACQADRAEVDVDALVARIRGLVAAYESGNTQPLSPEERAALPIALARQPLWSIGGWVALLDDEAAARRHAASAAPEVEWGLRLARDLRRWQAGLV